MGETAAAEAARLERVGKLEGEEEDPEPEPPQIVRAPVLLLLLPLLLLLLLLRRLLLLLLPAPWTPSPCVLSLACCSLSKSLLSHIRAYVAAASPSPSVLPPFL